MCFIKWEDDSQLWIKFKYERSFELCYKCGRIDHTKVVYLNSDDYLVSSLVPSNSYGPWMMNLSG